MYSAWSSKGVDPDIGASVHSLLDAVLRSIGYNLCFTILCAISNTWFDRVDMVKPQIPDRITLKDLRNCKMAANFFNVLFNLNKFIAMEQKDPFMSRGEEPESYALSLASRGWLMPLLGTGTSLRGPSTSG